jgi:CRP-like cAMP-binding protein
MTVRDIVDASGLFGGLPDEDRAALAGTGRVRRFRGGAYVWRVGDAEEGVYLLAEGIVHIGVIGPEGEEVVLHVVKAGEAMGEPGLYAPEGDRRTDGRAVGRVCLAHLRSDALRGVLERSPEAMRAFLRRLSELGRGHARRIASGVFLDARGRLARLLLDLAGSDGARAGRGVRITLPMSQRTLAGLVGLRRESVNRILAEYERDGVLACEGGVVTIFSPQALRAALGIEALLA